MVSRQSVNIFLPCRNICRNPFTGRDLQNLYVCPDDWHSVCLYVYAVSIEFFNKEIEKEKQQSGIYSKHIDCRSRGQG